jgi:hypothetical protein
MGITGTFFPVKERTRTRTLDLVLRDVYALPLNVPDVAARQPRPLQASIARTLDPPSSTTHAIPEPAEASAT